MRMSRFFVVMLLAAFGTLDVAVPAPCADETAILQQAHAWGRFGKGSWRRVRIVTESFDEDGNLTNSSTTDNKTSLEEVTQERVTLKVEVTVEIGGQRLLSPQQIIKQGYAGENVGQTVSIKPLQPELVTIAGREIRCETQEIEILGGTNKEVSQICYSPQLTPQILKRKSTLSDAASGKTTQEAMTEVYVLDKRLRVLGEEKTGFSVRQVQKNDRGSTTTVSDHVYEIPGEVVSHSSKKLDSQGRLVRRSTLELVAYGVEEDATQREPARGRTRRHKRGR